MYDFNHYYSLRQAGYDPKEIGRSYLRSTRSTLKGYIKRIDSISNEGTWGILRTEMQNLHDALSMPHDMNTLYKEISNYITKLGQFQSDHRMQDVMRFNVISILRELLSHIEQINMH